MLSMTAILVASLPTSSSLCFAEAVKDSISSRCLWVNFLAASFLLIVLKSPYKKDLVNNDDVDDDIVIMVSLTFIED